MWADQKEKTYSPFPLVDRLAIILPWSPKLYDAKSMGQGKGDG